MAEFTSQIYKLGINPVVDPPNEVLSELFEHAGRSRGAIPVRGRLNGAEFIQTLVKYQGSWRLYINGGMLKDSRLKVGDLAEIQIEFDPKPRDVAMPKKFGEALRKNKRAKDAFDALSPSRQKEILRYLGSLKTAESIDRNIERVMRHLRGESVDHVLMRQKRKS